MSRLEAWLTHIATILLTLTGIAYAWMHYMMKPSDPFSVVNHPWEPYMMDIHIVVAPLQVLLIGMLVRSHILPKIQTEGNTARKSGILLIPLFIVMTLSGYLLQVIIAPWKNILVVLHLASGALWFILYAGHYISSMRLRKLMRTNADFASEKPEQRNGVFTKMRAVR